MGIPIPYATDADFLREMERVASISKSPTNFVRIQTISLRRLIDLAKKGANP